MAHIAASDFKISKVLHESIAIGTCPKPNRNLQHARLACRNVWRQRDQAMKWKWSRMMKKLA